MDIKALTDFVVALGPALIAFTALITLVINTIQNIHLKKDLKAVKGNVAEVHEIINSRMTELKDTIKKENLLAGEKAGIATGVQQEADRNKKENDAYDLGKQVGKDRQIALGSPDTPKGAG